MPSLLRSFGLAEASPAERRSAAWIAAMSCAGLAAMFLLRPLRDQFGVDAGVESFPRLYTWTLLATIGVVLPFWWLADRMPSRRFVPVVVQVAAALLALLGAGLWLIGEYEWRQLPWLGEWFWGGFSALNVAVPSLAWIHAVGHFRSEQARRLFGLIAVGGTLGAVGGSWLAGLLCGADRLALPPWTTAVAAVLCLQAMLLCFRTSLSSCRHIGAATDRIAGGGLLEGMRLLRASSRARGIGVYMLLLGMLATAFAAAQTELVGRHLDAARAQHRLLADVEFWSQSLVLALQLFCTSRLLQRWPAAALLVSLPVVSIAGLLALWLAPAVLTINLVQIGRRGAQFALEKPAREVLYTPLPLAAKHKLKFLLDTFAFRAGDLLGAWLAFGLRALELGAGPASGATIAVAGLWIALGVRLGRPDQSASASTS